MTDPGSSPREKPEFPILISDTDGWLREVGDEAALQTDVEENDAWAEEYRGWDSRGRSFRIVWEDKRVAVVDLSREAKLADLERALAKYAQLTKLGSAFEPSGGEGSPRDRWARIFAAARRRPFWKRLLRGS